MKFTLPTPDDMHLHLRDAAMLKTVAPYTASQFARAIIMPNLVPPVTATSRALEYHAAIKEAAPQLEPLMALYLTDNTTSAEIKTARESGIVNALKLYPSGATTNSDAGVTDIKHTYKALEAMQEYDLPLLIHGEVTDPGIDIFDREAVFIERHLSSIIKDFPNLRVVLEHITTRQAAEFIVDAPDHVVATITAHHLLCNRNDMLVGGVKPHFYCLPILKRNTHQAALLKAALSGNKSFFAGTDSAPHLKENKENACGCAGSFTAANAIELYATAFDRAGDLSQDATQACFVNFMSRNGADFYGLPYNEGEITLVKESLKVVEVIDTPEGDLTPFWAGETLDWSIQ